MLRCLQKRGHLSSRKEGVLSLHMHGAQDGMDRNVVSVHLRGIT